MVINNLLDVQDVFKQDQSEISSNRISFTQGFIETFKRNIKIIMKYKFQIFNNFLNTMVIYSLYFFISLIVPGGKIETQYYTVSSSIFIFTGALITDFTSKILMSGLGSFQSEMRQGTFETLVCSAYGLQRYMYAEILAEVIYTVIKNIVFLIPVLFIFPIFSNLNLTLSSFLTLLALIASIFVFCSSLTLLGANFTIIIKRGREISMVIMGVLLLLSGVYYPIQLLPTWLRLVSYLSPLTQAINAFRLILFTSATLLNPVCWTAILILIGSSISLLLLSNLIFKKIYRRGQKTGNFAFY